MVSVADLEVVRLVRMNHPSQPREPNLIGYVLNLQSLDLQALELARLATTCIWEVISVKIGCDLNSIPIE